MKYFFQYLLKILEPLKGGLVHSLIFLGGVFTIIENLSNIQLAILLLIFTIFFDFITGIIASYIEYLEKVEKKIKYFDKVHEFFYVVLDSNKFRRTVIKSLTYFALMFVVYFIELIFFIEEKPIINTKEDLRLTLYVVGAFIGIEMYSAIFENMKRAGFDILESFKKAAEGINSIFTEIKNIITKFKL